MKRRSLVLFILLSLSGCGHAPFAPDGGLFYTDVKAPLSLEYNKTKVSSKVGESSAISVLYLVGVGDASVEEAAKRAGITTIEYVEYRYQRVYFFFSKTTVYVHGE